MANPSVCLSVWRLWRVCSLLRGLTFQGYFWTIRQLTHQKSWRSSKGIIPNWGIKCNGGRKKVAISDQYLTIAHKRLKTDGYMLLSVWPALNPLSIHVTFTAIVPGAYPRRPKCAKNVLKWRTFELTGWITEKRLKIDGYWVSTRCIWQALNPLFIHVTFTTIVPGAYPGEAKMCISQPISCYLFITAGAIYTAGE